MKSFNYNLSDHFKSTFTDFKILFRQKDNPGYLIVCFLPKEVIGNALHFSWAHPIASDTFIELIQPLSGQSMFHDYLAKYPLGGTQHLAYRLPVSEFEKITSDLCKQGYEVMSNVDHPTARMEFFDTYQTLGVANEIMGITPEG